MIQTQPNGSPSCFKFHPFPQELSGLHECKLHFSDTSAYRMLVWYKQQFISTRLQQRNYKKGKKEKRRLRIIPLISFLGWFLLLRHIRTSETWAVRNSMLWSCCNFSFQRQRIQLKVTYQGPIYQASGG